MFVLMSTIALRLPQYPKGAINSSTPTFSWTVKLFVVFIYSRDKNFFH